MNLIDPRDTTHSGETMSLCSLNVAGRTFAIDTHHVREVLSHGRLTRVPLAPACIVGILPYRGDVLTTVSLHALLGMPSTERATRIVVLDEEGEGERFGLLADSVGEVISVPRRSLDPLPSTLDVSLHRFMRSVFRAGHAFVVQLDPESLRPSRLIERDRFRCNGQEPLASAAEAACAL